MKQKLCLFALCMMIAAWLSPMQAQEEVQNNSSKLHTRWHLGVHGGTTVTQFDANLQFAYDRRYEVRHGSLFGITVGYDVFDWLTLRVAIDNTQKNYYYKRTHAFESVYCRYRNNYVNFPILADFSFGGQRLRGHALAGGYLGYWSHTRLSGCSITIDDNPNELSYYEYFERYEFDNVRDNRFDAGLAAGFGLSFTPIVSLRLSLEGMLYYGLTSTTKQYMRIADYRYLTTGVLQMGIEYQF